MNDVGSGIGIYYRWEPFDPHDDHWFTIVNSQLVTGIDTHGHFKGSKVQFVCYPGS